MAVQLRLLTPGDLAGLLHLSSSAGWNQTADDWLRLLRLWPEGCLGIEDDGAIVASATVALYGESLAWIGMVLTLPEYRGRGLARQLMEHSLSLCGSAVVRLDASDMGKPLYEQLGFVSECAIERWIKEPWSVEYAGREFDGAVDLALDLEVFGADRTELLRELAAYEVAAAEKCYAFGRPGANAAYFGPCVCENADQADSLARWFLTRHPGEAIAWDLFPDSAAAAVASALGFRPVRRLTRMVRRPGRVEQPDPRIYGIAGFEYG